MVIVYNLHPSAKSSSCIRNLLCEIYTHKRSYYSIYILKDFSYVQNVLYKRIEK